MAYNNPVLINRSIKLFVKEETTPGTLVVPSGSDYLEIKQNPTFDQQQSTTPITFMRSSRTKPEVTFDNFQYGTFSGVNIPARPSGTAGTAPTAGEKTLLKAALGKVTDSSTSGVSALTVSSITQANPAVITTSTAHSFKAGDKIAVTGATDTAYNISYVAVSVTSTTITTATDASALGSGAASDGSVSLKMTRFESAEELPYFSIWVITSTGTSTTGGAVLEAYSGCQISSFEVMIEKGGELTYSFGGSFVRKYSAGVGVLSATAATTGTTLTFSGASFDVDELFFVGQKVNVIDPVGTAVLSAPVLISAVNGGANTITVDAMTITSGPLPIGSIVVPYLPAGTVTGSILEKRTAKTYLAASDATYGQIGTDLFITGNKIKSNSGSVKLSQNLQKPLEKELTGDSYGSPSFIPADREITGDLAVVFRMDDQKYFESLKNNPRRALGFSIGDNAGSIIDFYVPKAFINVPSVGETEGARLQTFNYTAIEPAAGVEKELMIVYR